MTQNEQIALERYNNGESFSSSTFIDEDTIILGYGNLDYDFEFPLPSYITVKEYGTQSWTEYFRNKDLNKYITTNKDTKETSISPYLNNIEFEAYKILNPNFIFEKI
jgi:hypothetical protein